MYKCMGGIANETDIMMYVTFMPVMDGSKENEIFGQATASGDISMGIDTSVTDAVFEVGAKYYVDFTKVD
jgi:hypothetical protein